MIAARAACFVALVACSSEHSPTRVLEVASLEDGGAVVAWADQEHRWLGRFDIGGALAWKTELPRRLITTAKLTVRERLAVVREASGVHGAALRAFSLDDGHQVWQSELSNAAATAWDGRASSGPFEVFRDQVIAVEPATGRERHRVEFEVRGMFPLLFGDRLAIDGRGEQLVVGMDGHVATPLRGIGCTLSTDYYGLQADDADWLVTLDAKSWTPRRIATVPFAAERCFGYGNALVLARDGGMADPETTRITLVTREGVPIDAVTIGGEVYWSAYRSGETPRFLPLLQHDGLSVLDLEHLHAPPRRVGPISAPIARRVGTRWFVGDLRMLTSIDGETGGSQVVSLPGTVDPVDAVTNESIGARSVWLHSDDWTDELAITRLDPGTLFPTLPSIAVPILGVDATAEQGGRGEHP